MKKLFVIASVVAVMAILAVTASNAFGAGGPICTALGDADTTGTYHALCDGNDL